MALTRHDILTGPGCVEAAYRRAKFGHRNWLVWETREGMPCAAVESVSSLKRAMLDNGTQGRFVIFERSTGVGLTIGWRLAVIRLSWLKLGYRL